MLRKVFTDSTMSSLRLEVSLSTLHALGYMGKHDDDRKVKRGTIKSGGLLSFGEGINSQ